MLDVQSDPYGDRLRDVMHGWADECVGAGDTTDAIRHGLECLAADVIEAAVEAGIEPKDLFGGAMRVRKQRIGEGYTPRSWWAGWEGGAA